MLPLTNNIGRFLFFIIAIGCSVFFISCSRKTQIRGKIENYNTTEFKPYIYLIDPISFDGLLASYQGKIVDSTKVSSNGKFIFKNLEWVDLEMLELVLPKNNSKYLTQLEMDEVLLSNYIPIVIRKHEVIELHTDARQLLMQYKIKNASAVNSEIFNVKQDYINAYRKYLEPMGMVNEENLMEQETAKSNFKNDLIQSIKKCTDSHSILIGLKWMSKEADYERIPEFVFEQCQRLKKLDPKSTYVLDFCNKVNRDKLPLMIGDDMSNYLLPMQNKAEKKIGDLLGQKITIIDLWASWCGPCRKENKNVLVPLWDKFHTKGLQIVAYGLESNEITWIRAIDKDGANRWLHASHLEGDDSPLFKKWKISTIPANYLLDSNGKILQRNLHGEDLVKFIEEYLKD